MESLEPGAAGEALLTRVEHLYRAGYLAVLAAYVAVCIAVVFASGLKPAAWMVGVLVLTSAIPLEQLAHRSSRLAFPLAGLYVFVFAVTFFAVNIRLSVEWVALTLIGCALVTGRGVRFLKDWAVFLIVLVAWQVTDGLASTFKFPLHIRAMIDADKVIFYPALHGQNATVWLQQHLFDPYNVNWIDVMGVIFYSLHFLLPLGAGFVLWLVNRQNYYRYAIAFVMAAIMGFITYVLYPAVPPWMAVMHCPSVHGWACTAHNNWQHFLPWFFTYPNPAVTQPLLNSGHTTLPSVMSLSHWAPGVHDVWNFTMQGWISKNNGNVGFGPFHMGFDQVGAIPSEHAMYPTLIFLFFRRQFGRIAYLMIPYIAALTFSIVYMGQHYFIDAVVGALYAGFVYAMVMHVAPWAWRRLRPAHAEPAPSILPSPARIRSPELVALSERPEGVR